MDPDEKLFTRLVNETDENDETDFLQAEGDIVLACPTDLKTNSAALRYVLRECGIEKVFSLRPKVGEMLTIRPDVNPNPNQSVHLLLVRANQRAPLLTDDYLRCMTVGASHQKAEKIDSEHVG